MREIGSVKYLFLLWFQRYLLLSVCALLRLLLLQIAPYILLST